MCSSVIRIACSILLTMSMFDNPSRTLAASARALQGPSRPLAGSTRALQGPSDVNAGAKAAADEEPATAVYHVEAVQGGVAKLPCDVNSPVTGDKMHIVIWFKEGTTRNAPIYSFDSRDKSPMQGKHWADDNIFGGRAHLLLQDSPAKLTVDSVRDTDGGVYHCRVDFKQSRTRNVKVNLTIILPPEQLSILDDRGVHIPHYILGPYNEDAAINITCVATGGRPTPKVTWWQENALLDDSYEYLSDRRVRNILHLERLERKHLHTVFTCQASNNNMMSPISSAVTLEMNLRPLWVKLIGENRPLSANRSVELSCEVVGSRPPPTITWWKGSQQMKNTREIISPDSNKTTSVLTYVPTVEDAGKYLSCRGQQQQIPDSGIEDGWKLDIQHVPLVSLELGSNLNGSTIREGVDVYFECNIKSNPWVYKVSWQHNGKPLHNNPTAGTIVSNQSLVLQSVTRSRAGLYMCIGSNQEGEGESNMVELDVKFSPICRPGQVRVYGVARQEQARIPCELEANPTEVQYTWRFNNSAESIDIPQNHVKMDRTRSIALYTPMTEDDYGTLLCWGRNEIGSQREACVIHIIPAGKPDPLSNCTLQNQTFDTLLVNCVSGFDGGLQEVFIMEVYDTASNRLVSNVSSPIPQFMVAGLESGLAFNISLYAANMKGRSKEMFLQGFTLKSAERHIEPILTPTNCTLYTQTSTYLEIRCSSSSAITSSSTHSSVTYLLQAYDANTRMLLATATSQTPEQIKLNLPQQQHQQHRGGSSSSSSTLSNGDNRRQAKKSSQDVRERSSNGGLLLFIRAVSGASISSEAAVVYAPPPQEMLSSGPRRLSGSTPVFLHITPILGTLIGVVTALILLAIIIVVVIRLRDNHPRDDKDYDDGGLSSINAPGIGVGGVGTLTSRRPHCVSGADKASTEPLNKDLNDSVDSLDEKNPDIIPLSNGGEEDYQAEERAFERLNVTGSSIRLVGPGYGVSRGMLMQGQNNIGLLKNGPYDYLPKTNEDITYAELSLTGRQLPPPQSAHHLLYTQAATTQPHCTNTATLPMSVLRRPNGGGEPTVYAQIDPNGTLLTGGGTLNRRQMNPAFAGMQMHHLPPYMTGQGSPVVTTSGGGGGGGGGGCNVGGRPRADYGGQHHHQQQQHQQQEGISAETTLLNTARDTSALQPLLESGTNRTPTITSSVAPRVVTATRF